MYRKLLNANCHVLEACTVETAGRGVVSKEFQKKTLSLEISDTRVVSMLTDKRSKMAGDDVRARLITPELLERVSQV